MSQRNVTSKNPPTQKHQIDVSCGKLGMDASPNHQVSGATLNNFQWFFQIKLIAWITWLQYYKLKPLQPFFSRCKNDCFIACDSFCQVNTTKLFRVIPLKWGNFEQRDSYFSCHQNRKNLYSVYIQHAQINPWFLHIPGHIGRN